MRLIFTMEGFEWIDSTDVDNGIISFMRKGNDWHDSLIVICNFTPNVYDNYRVGLPFDTHYDEILNSDAKEYGGSGVVNLDGFTAEKHSYHNKPYSAEMRIPPLAVMILRPEL